VKSRWAIGRTEAFSDGVFAIAITLLVLDLEVPQSGFDDMWTAIGDQWPQYMGFATSFFAIGGIWLTHHGIFSRLEYANTRIMRLNLLLLMAVVFLPFPTQLMSDAINDRSAEQAAVIFYGGSLFVCSLLLTALWSVASRNRALLKKDISDQEISAVLRVASPNLGFYVTATILALFAPRAAVFAYLIIAVMVVLRAHGDEDLVEDLSAAG
jgi:uncharacterized membrane protein